MNRYFVGVDLGQVKDPTTIAVVERAELKGEWNGATFAWRKKVMLRLRYLDRLRLGTPYPEGVDQVMAVTHSGELSGNCYLAVDGTGGGPAGGGHDPEGAAELYDAAGDDHERGPGDEVE